MTFTLAALGIVSTLIAALAGPALQSRLQRKSAVRAERAAALQAYLAAISTLAAEMTQLPDVPVAQEPGRIRRWLKPHGGESLLYLYARLGERVVFGSRPRLLSDRIADAHARVVLARPGAELVSVMDEVGAFFGSWGEDGRSGWRTHWPALNHRLTEAVAREAER